MKPNQTQFHQPESNSGPSENRRVQNSPGFTAIELALVLVVPVFLALAFTPALAKTRLNPKALQCQNNLRRLAAAWSIYAGDYSDRVADNFGVNETLSSLQTGQLENWVNNIMTWGASTATSDRSNTYVVWVTNGVLGKYLGSAFSVYRCPSDNYLSPVQAAAGWTARLRSGQ